MSTLNKYWLILIALGVFMLVCVGAWEIYQIASGNRSEVNYTITGFDRGELIPKNLEDHFQLDPDFTVTRQSEVDDQEVSE